MYGPAAGGGGAAAAMLEIYDMQALAVLRPLPGPAMLYTLPRHLTQYDTYTTTHSRPAASDALTALHVFLRRAARHSIYMLTRPSSIS